jgi:hypothetical protein
MALTLIILLKVNKDNNSLYRDFLEFLLKTFPIGPFHKNEFIKTKYEISAQFQC